MSYSDSMAPLHICEDEVLGKGGFGFVCKGEIQVSGAAGTVGWGEGACLWAWHDDGGMSVGVAWGGSCEGACMWAWHGII